MSGGGRLPIIIPRLDDAEQVSADERDEHLMLLESARQTLEAEWTQTLVAADAVGDHDLFGYPSTIAYLKARLNIAAGRAKRYVRLARFCRQFSASFAAWRQLQVNSDQTELLARAAEKLPDKYPEAEPVVLEIIGDTPEETRRVLEYWTAGVEREPAEVDTQLQRRYFDHRRTETGMVEGEFALPALAGETLATALDAVMPPPRADDERTSRQRRADALEDLARIFLDHTAPSDVAGERPHLNVHVDLPALEGTAGRLHETDTGTVLTMETVRQLACDATVSRIVFAAPSEVLDVGRRTRVIPAGLRRAVVARDRHCIWGSCGRKAGWTDVHHIIFWADGGPTELSNLCLLCRYHHTLVHLSPVHNLMLIERLHELGVLRST